MPNCNRLFPAQNISAFYSAPLKVLFISADVPSNPISDQVQICRNPLDPLLPPPAVPSFTVGGTTLAGIHPDLVATRHISASFAVATMPAKIIVYSMGVDNPARVEVNVGLPPEPVAPAQANTPAKAGSPGQGTPLEATGWSTGFVLQEALANAVTELRAAAGFRNPDAGLGFEVVAIGGQIGGFTLHTGVFVKVRAA
jgi:hypothetical protein